MKKTALLFGAAIVLCATAASAAVLGEASDDWVTQMGGGAVYVHTEYDSDAGKQTENYVEYTPNSEAVPIIENGRAIYGKRTITAAADYMEENGLRPLIGINGDFFSFQTGIQMGNSIIDGKVFSNEGDLKDTVGFCADGTAFIDKLQIETEMTHDGETEDVLFVNKWMQKGYDCIVLLTDDFGETTHTDFEAYYIICSAESGDLSVNTTMTLKAEETFLYDGSITIPSGKYVFVMDPAGNEEYCKFLSEIEVGDTVTFTSKTSGAERNDWSKAVYATSSEGGRLLNNGEIGSGFEAGAAPRTAVGVTEDGRVIFYTLDGRQSGYSYGAQITTIAKRMSELGCIDALNLDGGGSTAIGAIFPGEDVFRVTNKPSDGDLRNCANYIFLRDLREKTGIPWYVEWKETSKAYLAGTTLRLEATKVYDSGNYKMDSLTGVSYTVENSSGANSSVTDEGEIAFVGTGTTDVTVTGEKYGKTFSFKVYESPEEIRVTDTAEGETVEEITVERGTQTLYELEAAAYADDERIESVPSLFKWEAQGGGIAVDEDGRVSITGEESGTVTVSVGDTSKTIPITITEKETFEDMDGHWAQSVVNEMARKNIINGFEEDGHTYFKPDNVITRTQFAAVVCKALGTDISRYGGVSLDFADVDKIQAWAADYIKAMVGMGYISGRAEADGMYFDPDSGITRAETFTILGRLLTDTAAGELTYSDADTIPDWAYESVAKLETAGIISGFSDNTIRPFANTTRAEAAVLISKFSD